MVSPWYWTHSDNCPDYCVVEAFPINKNANMPSPGSCLSKNSEGDWVSENGLCMIIDREIFKTDQKDGEAICRFIAASHAVNIVLNKKFFIETNLHCSGHTPHVCFDEMAFFHVAKEYCECKDRENLCPACSLFRRVMGYI